MFLPSLIPFPDALHPFQSLSLIPFSFCYLPYIFTLSPFTLFHIYHLSQSPSISALRFPWSLSFFTFPRALHLFQSPSLVPFASLDPSHIFTFPRALHLFQSPSLVPFASLDPSHIFTFPRALHLFQSLSLMPDLPQIPLAIEVPVCVAPKLQVMQQCVWISHDWSARTFRASIAKLFLIFLFDVVMPSIPDNRGTPTLLPCTLHILLQ